jgi:hypothetical protein
MGRPAAPLRTVKPSGGFVEQFYGIKVPVLFIFLVFLRNGFPMAHQYRASCF